MAKKLAVFTEGETEACFVRKLLVEVAGNNNITFRSVSQKGNQITILEDEPQNLQYYVLIFNCRQDERVKSEILNNRDSLIKQGYEMVLGLRDLYPRPLADLQKVEMYLQTRVPTKDLPIHILLAVSEIEAWFLQEENHYETIDAALTCDNISNQLSFDPRTDLADKIHHPSGLLHDIYALAGKAYKKKMASIQRTVNSLDYNNLYFGVRPKLSHFDAFMNHVDDFLA